MLLNRSFVLLTGLLLLGVFGIASYNLQRGGLWTDEAWTYWAVHDVAPDSAGTQAVDLPSAIALRFQYLGDTVSRVAGDVHPPLYFLILNCWISVAGDSIYAVRLLSAFFALIGAAAMYGFARKLFDRWTGLIAVIILGTSSFFVYYAREARMYSLLLALAVFSTWLFWRWRERQMLGRAALYALSMAALLYTQYVGAAIILGHLLFMIVVDSRRIVYQAGRSTLIIRIIRTLSPFMAAFVLFVPWLPVATRQLTNHPNGPLSIPIPTNLDTINNLIAVVTSGVWLLCVAPLLLGRELRNLAAQWQKLLLLVIWLILTPAVLLTLNARLMAIYQLRYVIAMLPAWAILIGVGIRGLDSGWIASAVRRVVGNAQISKVLAGGFVAALAYVQLTAFPLFWFDKPPWQETIGRMVHTRQPGEPTITKLAPISAEAYYDRLLGIRRDPTITLDKPSYSRAEIAQMLRPWQGQSSVWMAMPSNIGETWDAAAWLSENRGVGYRDGLINMVFYRFDAASHDRLRFQFGHGPGVARIGYEGRIDGSFTIQPDSPLCLDTPLRALSPVDGSLSIGVYIVSAKNQVVAQWDGGIGSHAIGDRFSTHACLSLAASLPADSYRLQLAVYPWASPQDRLWVLEGPDDHLVFWENALVIGSVNQALS